MNNPLEGVRINPWADRTPTKTKRKPKPEPTAHPVLMAARARRARRMNQQTRMDADQEATA